MTSTKPIGILPQTRTRRKSEEGPPAEIEPDKDSSLAGTESQSTQA